MALILFTVFLDLLGVGLIFPIGPFYATAFGADAFQVGLLFTLFSVAQFLTIPLLALLSDRYGRRPVLLIGIAGLQDWDALFATNLHATFATCRAAASAMKRAGQGRIINLSSGAGLRPSLTRVQAYTSAKHAVVGLTRQLAHEFGPFGITVNGVAPGLVLTTDWRVRQWESYGPDGQQEKLERTALRRLGTIADIKNVVLFFASDLASFVTGQILPVDGGTF